MFFVVVLKNKEVSSNFENFKIVFVEFRNFSLFKQFSRLAHAKEHVLKSSKTKFEKKTQIIDGLSSLLKMDVSLTDLF